MASIEATIPPHVYAGLGTTHTPESDQLQGDMRGVRDETAEDLLLRIVMLARVHNLILRELEDLDPDFYVTGVNLPYCGPNAASEVRMIKHIYGDVPIRATDVDMQYIEHASTQLDRICDKDDFSTSGVEIMKSRAQSVSTYSTQANVTIERNVPILNRYTGLIDHSWKRSLLALKEAQGQRAGYLAITFYTENAFLIRQARTALKNAGYTVLKELKWYPCIDTINGFS